MRSSIVAAAAGALTTVPGLAGILGAAAPEGAALDGVATETQDELATALADSDGPLVAHVRDASAGEVSILNGTREVVVRDPRLVARLVRAAR